jgi:hypoxanthine-guanine phosphoribosyltransferase
MDKDIQTVLITQEQLQQRIAQLGEELTRDYEGKNPVIVGEIGRAFV